MEKQKDLGLEYTGTPIFAQGTAVGVGIEKDGDQVSAVFEIAFFSVPEKKILGRFVLTKVGATRLIKGLKNALTEGLENALKEAEKKKTGVTFDTKGENK